MGALVARRVRLELNALYVAKFLDALVGDAIRVLQLDVVEARLGECRVEGSAEGLSAPLQSKEDCGAERHEHDD